jgi:hypothetical protein
MANPVIDTYKGVLACLINCATATGTEDLLKLNSEIDKYKQSLEDLKKISGNMDDNKIYLLEEFGTEFIMDLVDVFRHSGRYR